MIAKINEGKNVTNQNAVTHALRGHRDRAFRIGKVLGFVVLKRLL